MEATDVMAVESNPHSRRSLRVTDLNREPPVVSQKKVYNNNLTRRGRDQKKNSEEETPTPTTRLVTWHEQRSSQTKSVIQFLQEAFLPDGYPHSVSSDYMTYQIYDTLQAFCSNITGLLATRAIFKRAGVGDAAATATAATLIKVMQEVTGMLGRILFAWQVSFALDADCKNWRFYADILNDAAVFIEVLAPSLPKSWFIGLACSATLLRSLCGVAGGSTKAALSQHFAIRENMADLNAKDGSQETVVGLVGMLIGSYVVQSIADDAYLLTWGCFILFTILHLVFNYRGVSAVVIPSLNRQRAFLVFKEFHQTGLVVTPKQTAAKEAIIWPEPDGISLGEKLSLVLEQWSEACGERQVSESTFNELLAQHKGFKHVLAVHTKSHKVLVALNERISAKETLLAFFHAYFVKQKLSKVKAPPSSLAPGDLKMILVDAIRTLEKDFDKFLIQLEDQGWQLDDVRSRISTLPSRWTIKENTD